MTSYQDAVESDWDQTAKEFDGVVMYQRSYSNVGTALVGAGPAEIWFSLGFNFQTHGPTMLLFNGKKHGPETKDNYYFNATDTDAYNRAMDRFRDLCSSRGEAGDS